jgi:hypothetical protein
MNTSDNGGAPPAIFLDPSIDWASINGTTWPIWVLTLVALVILLGLGYFAIKHAIWPIFTSAKDAVRILRNRIGPD